MTGIVVSGVQYRHRLQAKRRAAVRVAPHPAGQEVGGELRDTTLQHLQKCIFPLQNPKAVSLFDAAQVYSNILFWIINTPTFQMTSLLVSSPLSLSVALWGMSGPRLFFCTANFKCLFVAQRLPLSLFFSCRCARD